MSFKTFQASRTKSANLGLDLEDASLLGEPGYLYANGQLYIEIESIPECKFRLTLDRDTYVSSDLSALERSLYAFAAKEGYWR